MEILREQWLWHGTARRIWLWHPYVLGVVASVVVFPFERPLALMLLCIALAIGALIGSIYGYVGKKVRALKQSLAEEEGEMAEVVAQIGNTQSPAVAIMKKQELVLVPLVGDRLTVPFADIQSVQEGGTLYGKGFLWKCVFKIKTPQKRHIGFAVPPSVADRWRRPLRQGRPGRV
jgi:hypothetical protein